MEEGGRRSKKGDERDGRKNRRDREVRKGWRRGGKKNKKGETKERRQGGREDKGAEKMEGDRR